jgi:hypothetical protein
MKVDGLTNDEVKSHLQVDTYDYACTVIYEINLQLEKWHTVIKIC